MDPTQLFFLGMGAVGLLSAAVALGTFVADRRRRDALARLAATWEVSFYPDPPPGTLRPYDHLPLFSLGRGARARHLLYGDLEGTRFELFEYRFRTGTGKNQRNHRLSVLGVRAPLGLPRFAMRPENVFERIGAAFGAQDIDFAQSPGFSRLYVLQGDEAAAVKSRFSADLLAFFERHEGWRVEGHGDALVLYRADRVLPVEEVRATVHLGIEIARLLARTRSPAA